MSGTFTQFTAAVDGATRRALLELKRLIDAITTAATALTARVVVVEAATAAIGPVGSGTLAATQAVTTAAGITDITSTTVTWTADPLRAYRTTLQIGAADQTVANGVGTAYITDPSNVLKRNEAKTIVSGARSTFHLSVIESGLSGSTTRKARIATSGGTITLVATGAATFAPLLTVEDIGPA